MRFELHCHSHYSKGKKIPSEGILSPRDVIRTAKNIGLGGIALTDHSSSRCWPEAEREARRLDIVFIPGIEIASEEGHVLGLGLNEHVGDKLSLEETIDKIHEQGGLAIAAHPFDIRGDGIRHGMAKTDAVEVFNAISLDRVSNMFSESRADKLGMSKIAGSDAHSKEMIGTAVNIIDASDMDSALKCIKNGSIGMQKRYIPLSVLTEWIRSRMTRSYTDILNHIGKNYWFPKSWFARFFLKRFVFSKSQGKGLFWNASSHISLGIVMAYSGIKVFGYY